MKTNNLNRIAKTIFIIGILSIIIYIIIKSQYESKKRADNPQYTIGLIINVRARAKLSVALEYSFKVNYEGYKSIRGIEKYNTKLIGKRFYVKFESGNPDNCEILLDKPVPDSIKEAPPEGWAKIPK
ncbi:MAG: hypothetical protein JXR51_08085 [Bacteroidales bacterium]|nr:hypothetical protein [Bacteroidales bacterium]